MRTLCLILGALGIMLIQLSCEKEASQIDCVPISQQMIDSSVVKHTWTLDSIEGYQDNSEMLYSNQFSTRKRLISFNLSMEGYSYITHQGENVTLGSGLYSISKSNKMRVCDFHKGDFSLGTDTFFTITEICLNAVNSYEIRDSILILNFYNGQGKIYLSSEFN